jgi:hypothetical protein
MLQERLSEPLAVPPSSHFKQRTPSGATPAAMLDSSIKMSLYQELC